MALHVTWYWIYLCPSSILPEAAAPPTSGGMRASQQIPLRRRHIDRRGAPPDASNPIPDVRNRRDPF